MMRVLSVGLILLAFQASGQPSEEGISWRPSGRVWNSSNITGIAVGSYVQITFNTSTDATKDTYLNGVGFLSNKLVAQQAGLYSVGCSATLGVSTSPATQAIRLQKNSTVVARSVSTTTGAITAGGGYIATTNVRFAPGDTLECDSFSDGSGTYQVTSVANDTPAMWMTFLNP